jgi:hypothetical protein
VGHEINTGGECRSGRAQRCARVRSGPTARGIGAGLLKDAMLRSLAAAEIAGIRAFVVRAKDDNARSFYAHVGFESLTEVPLTLYRLIKDIQQTAGGPPSKK